jgi:hypothetical protein
MAKSVRLINPSKEELLRREREVLGINLTSIMGENKLKIETYGYKDLRSIKECLNEAQNASGMLVAAMIDRIEFKQANSGNYFYWIHLIDDWTSIKIYCSEKSFKEMNGNMIVGRCVLFNINIRNDFATFDKCMIMENIPFKKGYIFVAHLEYGKWTNAIKEFFEDEIDVTIRRGNCRVYLRTYPYDLFVDPSYELIARVQNKFGIKCSVELEDDFLWGRVNKLIEENDIYEHNNKAM